MKLHNILTEAQDYIGMFNDIFRWNSVDTLNRYYPSENKYDLTNLEHALKEYNKNCEGDAWQNINWAREYLKRNDRIVWYLKMSKVWMVANGRNVLMSVKPEEVLSHFPFFTRWVKESGGDQEIIIHQCKTAGDGWRHKMLHLLSLPVPKIQNHVWGYESPWSLVLKLENYEKEWQEKVKSRISYDPEDFKEIFLDFYNGWMWVDLGRASCSKEAEAMGHCGNVPSEQEGQTILSLRQLKTEGKTKHFEPHLTFILDKDGYLGEMKGRANEKPVERYHTYITKLLEDPRIKGINGGGYAPEENFSISDLPEPEMRRLLSINPELLDINSTPMLVQSSDHALRTRAQTKLSAIIGQNIDAYNTSSNFNGKISEGSYIISASPHLLDALKNISGHKYETIYREYTDGIDVSNYYDSSSKNIKDFIPYKAYDHILHYTLATYNEEYITYCENEEIDEDDAEHAIDFLLENGDDELGNLYHSSIEQGYSYGIQKTANEILKDILGSVYLSKDTYRDEPNYIDVKIMVYVDGKIDWPEYLPVEGTYVSIIEFSPRSYNKDWDTIVQSVEDGFIFRTDSSDDESINPDNVYNNKAAEEYFLENLQNGLKIHS